MEQIRKLISDQYMSILYRKMQAYTKTALHADGA